VAEAKKEWGALAQDIKHGKKKSMLAVLEERGLVHNVTG
jgi:tyrosyl-tRNA synthetase